MTVLLHIGEKDANERQPMFCALTTGPTLRQTSSSPGRRVYSIPKVRSVADISHSILIAHPDALSAQGLCHILSNAGYGIGGVLSNLDELRREVRTLKPELVLLDLALANTNVPTLGELAEQSCVVVILDASTDSSAMVDEAMRAGASGCLSFKDEPDVFLASLQLLLQGSTVMSTETVDRQSTSEQKREGNPCEALSVREQQLAKLVAQGYSNKEIAEELMISEHTVKIHLGNILNKTGLRNRQQLAAEVARHGMLEDIMMADGSA